MMNILKNYRYFKDISINIKPIKCFEDLNQEVVIVTSVCHQDILDTLHFIDAYSRSLCSLSFDKPCLLSLVVRASQLSLPLRLASNVSREEATVDELLLINFFGSRLTVFDLSLCTLF